MNKMMTKPVVRVNLISILEACRNKAFWPQFTRIAPPPPPPPPPPPEQFNFKQQSQSGFHNNNNNPCVDLYFHCAKGQDAMSTVEFHETLMKQALPSAWSHNPLTTLKLICNFIDRRGDGGKWNQDKAFFTAAVWLHQNHPKTLACNLVPISGYFGHIRDLPRILSQVLRGEAHLKFTGMTREEVDSNGMVKVKEKDAKSKASDLLRRRKAIHTANKACERYNRDADYRFLHDCVSDIFAQCLESDIEKFHHHKDHDHDHHDDYCLEITQAATALPTTADHHMLFENIARKVFPQESCRREGDGSVCCIDRLRKEVLSPLRKPMALRGWEPANRWGYRVAFKREQVVAADEIDPHDAVLLPHDVLSYIKYPELEQEADVKWKKMVEVYSKQGKLRNWLAVCDVDNTLSAGLALGLLLPQLSDEPWKGKVVAYSKNPRLHSIQGEDLNSRAKYMQTLIKSQDWTADFGKVFDVILEEAVNANLKPDKMVKKVLALTTYKHFLTGSNFSFWGETNYEEIRNKYKEKGYGDVVPHLVIWNMIKPEYSAGHCREPEPGVTLLSGFSNKLLKSFFENDGDIGPNHVMEAAVSAPAYQTLAVVD